MLLKIEAFRGVNEPFELNFDTRQNLTVLYGENGCGKTTITDAFEFLFKGTSGSLEEKSLDGKARLGQLVHAKRSKSDLSVSFTENNKTRKATLPGTKPVLQGDLDSVLHVLSRKSITKLIDDTPSNRFARIQEFVEVPALDREERTLRELINGEKKRLDGQLKAIQQNDEILDDLFTQNKKDASETKRNLWITNLLRESNESVAENLALLTDLNVSITRLRDDFKSLASSYTTLSESEQEADAQQKALTKLVETHTDDLALAFTTLE